MNGDINRSIGTSGVCYFCNETIGSAALLQNHVKQCGNILEKCHIGCGAWIERKHKISHGRKCPVNGTYHRQTSHTLNTRSSLGATIYHALEDQAKEANFKSIVDNIEYLKRELLSVRNAIREEQDKNVQLINELEKMRRQYVLSEERNQIIVATMSAMRRSNEDESISLKLMISELKNEINILQEKQHQECENHHLQMEQQLRNLNGIINQERNERVQLELVLNNQDGKIRNIQKLEADLNEMKNMRMQEVLFRDDQMFKKQQQIDELKELVIQESALVKQRLQNVQTNQNDTIKIENNKSDLLSKLELLEFELRSLKVVVEEDSSTIGMMDKNISTLSHTISHLKESGKVVDVNHDICNIPNKIVDTTGHLMWRIDCYQQKLKDAIENGSILLSSVFLSSQYGYTLQAELNLNGIGKGKGRHLTAAVFIIPGEYDPILSWPASLQADIIFKDQKPPGKEPMDLIKSLAVRRKDNATAKSTSDLTKVDMSKRTDIIINDDQNYLNESSMSLKRKFISIPHISLDKFDYTKNNVMFIEIHVTKV